MEGKVEKGKVKEKRRIAGIERGGEKEKMGIKK